MSKYSFLIRIYKYIDTATLGDCSCRHFTTQRGKDICKTSVGKKPTCIVKNPTTCSDIDNKESKRQPGYSMEACEKYKGIIL